MSNDTVVQLLEPSAPEPHPRRRRRSTSTRSQRIALAVVIALSICTAVLFCETAPTGNGIIDALYRSALITLTVLAGARARRRVLLISAALVSVGTDGWTVVPALIALALSFALAWIDRRERVAGGLAGALIGYCAMNLAWPASPDGATVLLAGAALLPLWVSGYRVARRQTRRLVRMVAAAAVVIMLVGTLSGVVLAATQRSTLESAAESTESAAAVVASGSTSGSSEDLRASAEKFAEVADAAGSWWATPASLVPVVAQNTRAIRAAASTGADLSGVAADLASGVDYDALARPDGSLDVQTLASYEPLANETHATVTQARSDLEAVASPWLVAPVAQRLDEYLAHLDRAESATAIAATATAELPAMLGMDGPKRYLLLLGSPAEARDLGGHIGNWAELTAVDGRLDVIEVGQPYELFGPMSDNRPSVSEGLDLPASLLEVDPTRFPQNWGSSPDLSTVARLAADLFPQARGGAPIDGVIYADPTAFAALLSVTGPVTVGDTTLSADNAVKFLTRDQYAAEVPDHVVNDLVRGARSAGVRTAPRADQHRQGIRPVGASRSSPVRAHRAGRLRAASPGRSRPPADRPERNGSGRGGQQERQPFEDRRVPRANDRLPHPLGPRDGRGDHPGRGHHAQRRTRWRLAGRVHRWTCGQRPRHEPDGAVRPQSFRCHRGHARRGAAGPRPTRRHQWSPALHGRGRHPTRRLSYRRPGPRRSGGPWS